MVTSWMKVLDNAKASARAALTMIATYGVRSRS